MQLHDSSPSFEPGSEIEIDETPLYQAVLLDLDGTLLSSAGEVSERARQAIHDVQRRGFKVMIVTGRSVGSAAKAVAEVRLELPLSCYNGGALYCSRSEKLIEQKVLSHDIARTMVFGLEERGLDFFVNHHDDKYTLAPRSDAYARALEGLEHVHFVDRIDDMPLHEVARVTVLDVPERVHAVQEELRSLHDPHIYIEGFHLSSLPSHREFDLQVCDVHPQCAGKAEALYYLEEKIGIPRQDVIAVGDGLNDLAMMRGAGMAAAMANAHPDVLDAADRVLGHHDRDGVAEFLEETFLRERL